MMRGKENRYYVRQREDCGVFTQSWQRNGREQQKRLEWHSKGLQTWQFGGEIFGASAGHGCWWLELHRLSDLLTADG